MTKNIARLIVVLWTLSAVSAHAIPLIDFYGRTDTQNWVPTSYTLGYSFAVSSSVTLDAFGVFDFQGNGLASVHDVGLWTSGGALISSGTVGPASVVSETAVSGLGNYVYDVFSPLTLGVGTYILGANYTSSNLDVVVYNATGIHSNVAGTSYFDLQWDSNGGGGIVFPGNSSTNDDRYFGPTMRVSAIPEPGTMSLLALGIAGIGFLKRRRR